MKFWERLGAPSPEAAYLHLCAWLNANQPENALAVYSTALRYLVEVETRDP